MSQLITISPTGELTSLQFKKGKGLDLRPLGHAEISRSSLIEWDEQEQAWFVRLLECAIAPDGVLTPFLWKNVLAGQPAQSRGGFGGEFAPIYFDEYDDAVTAEINFIQAVRQKLGVGAA